LLKCIGLFKSTKQHGHGTCYWTSGNKYEGNFENDSRNGFGIYTFSEDSSYEFDRYKGYWKNAARHGNGTLYW
jgi:hypothetical protein